jgi:hypothetical protein
MDLDSESREKGLPTIFKYSGAGNEVYVCGKLIIPLQKKKNYVIQTRS